MFDPRPFLPKASHENILGAHHHSLPKTKVSQSKRGRGGIVQRSGKDLEVRFILLITESKIRSLNLVDFVLRS